MKLVRGLFFAIFLVPLFAHAVCGSHELAKPEKIRLTGDSVMIVVHASSTYDARFATKRGLDEAVRFAKSKNIPVVYLQDDTPDQFYFMEDCQPTYWAASQGGEVTFDVPPSHLYIVGGHLELCMSAALHDILFQWSKRLPRDLTVTYFMDAIYSNGKSVDMAAPYFQDFTRFMDIVTYGRAGGEHWPKLSLLEMMGVIVSPEEEIKYLQSVLPRWETTFPKSYQVEMQLNGYNKIVLREVQGWAVPKLRFEFLDSALATTGAELADH